MAKKEKIDELNAEQLIKELDGKKELLQISEISLILDTYDDIFSDFDPRPFSERALSDDFLLEAKKAARDKEEGIELKFLIPEKSRNLEKERLIIKRLRDHFKKHHEILHKDMKKIIYEGLGFVISGIIIMFIATLLLSKSTGATFFTNFLIVIMEPGGWFLFWEGLNVMIFDSRKVSPELSFYEKMKKCEVSFISY